MYFHLINKVLLDFIFYHRFFKSVTFVVFGAFDVFIVFLFMENSVFHFLNYFEVFVFFFVF
jgi:hypothetical protein